MDERTDTRIAALEAEIARLRSELVGQRLPKEPATSDRRGMVKLMVAGAVGAVTGAAAAQRATSSCHGRDPVLQGVINEARRTTVIDASARLRLERSSGGSSASSATVSSPTPIPRVRRAPSGPEASSGVLYIDVWGLVGSTTARPDAGQGRWRKIAGPGTAGQLHVLPTPVRVYDSRPGEAPRRRRAEGTAGRQHAADDRHHGNASGVPATATAVLVEPDHHQPANRRFRRCVAGWAHGRARRTSTSPPRKTSPPHCRGLRHRRHDSIQSNTITDFLIDVIGYYE